MKSVRLFAAAFMVAILVGCAALGSPTPDTFNQKLAVTVAGLSEVRNTATTLLTAKKISVDDAKNIQAAADVGREGLNVARGMSSTDLTQATTRLELVNASLRTLQAYLVSKQGTAP